VGSLRNADNNVVAGIDPGTPVDQDGGVVMNSVVHTVTGAASGKTLTAVE